MSISFLLSKMYEDRDPVIIGAGAEGLPYDLLIPHPLVGSPSRGLQRSASRPEVGGMIERLQPGRRSRRP
ncbi:MAG: hypothetical protein QXH67_02700 [Candidatus Bathyarchaeia archaeon]